MKNIFIITILFGITYNTQTKNIIYDGYSGTKIIGNKGIKRITEEINTQSIYAEQLRTISSKNDCSKNNNDEIGLNFLGARLVAFPSVNFPPDTMGAVGPSQFIVAINGRIRTFDKKTGIADLILDTTMDDFFLAVSGGKTTTDPRIRYDRLSGRWFVVMVTGEDKEEEPDVSECSNLIMIAVSDDKNITRFTQWSFFAIPAGEGFFFDYPTLGIDANALYIGGITFLCDSGFTENQRVYVINKKLILENQLEFTQFEYIVDPAAGGESVLQGVDNFDEDASVGYFIGMDSFSPNHLVIHRIFNPGESPIFSNPILIEIPTVCFPLSVPHRGNTGGEQKNLDALDARLMMAHIRNGHLWTAHHIGVNNKGICSEEKEPTRDGARWYEIDITREQPVLVQHGTLFEKSKKNTFDKQYYWMPSLMTSGQGIMAIGSSRAGENEFINAIIARRFPSDPKGTLQKPIVYADSHTAYNPNDPNEPLRWGDYSYTSVDPCDDMTLWTIQEYCNDVNQWGLRVAQLKAPAPAQLTSTMPSKIKQGKSSATLIINGRSKNDSGFFDPGKNFDCRLNVKISGGVSVEKITYLNPTTIKAIISTKKASLGSKKITVINPDGQKVKADELLTVVS